MNTVPHILIVDDEPAVRSVLRLAFEAAGYATSEAGGRTSLFRHLENDTVDLITLDLTLGEDDGFELAQEIRRTRNVPIVMVTGRDGPHDRIKGLEQGADDYVAKPFHVREVILRVAKLLARYSDQKAPRFAE